MFTTCSKCQKQNDYWDSRSQKEPVMVNGKTLAGAFTYSKYFCPFKERRVKNSTLSADQEKVLISDCLNGDRTEIREIKEQSS